MAKSIRVAVGVSALRDSFLAPTPLKTETFMHISYNIKQTVCKFEFKSLSLCYYIM